MVCVCACRARRSTFIDIIRSVEFDSEDEVLWDNTGFPDSCEYALKESEGVGVFICSMITLKPDGVSTVIRVARRETIPLET